MKLAPPEPEAPRPFALPRFTAATLASGLPARAARWGRRATVAVSVLFPGAGSAADPPGREGTAEITAETFLGGTRTKTARQLAEAIDDLAAVVDVSCGSDSSIARLYVLERDLPRGLDLLAEVLTETTFPEEEFEKNRNRQIDLVSEQRSEPDFLVRERLLAQLYPGHPYGRFTANERALAALTRDDIARFAGARFGLAGASVVLAGAAGPDALLEAVSRALGCLPASGGASGEAVPPAPAIERFSVHLVHRPGSVQTNLLFARPAIPRAHPKYVAALVANQSLGGGASSRLFSVLREERGLTYGAYSSLSPRRVAGHFGASIDCRTEVTKAALDGLLGLIRAFAEDGPTESEHERSIRYLLGSFALSRETPGAIVQDEVVRLLHGLPEDEWETWRARVGAVTREDARAAASELFDPKTGILAAVGDAAAIRPILESFGETTLWDSDGPRA